MSQPFVGEIRMFAGNFPPLGWELCDGALYPIAENETLFQLIGTTYGGDGETTFAVPDLRGRVPIHVGQGPGLTSRIMGEAGGVESVTLTTQQLPIHSHALTASTAGGTSANAQNNVLASPPGINAYIEDAPSAALPAAMVAPVGGSQPHDNLQPYGCVNYIIAFSGVFPQPS